MWPFYFISVVLKGGFIMLEKNQRETFSSKFGFLISCVGAALGLGNIWLFSYRLGTYGGAAFLIPYFIFIFLLGTTGLITEFSFGRIFKAGATTGISEVFKSRGLKGAKFISLIPVLGIAGVLMFYSVVVGWILKYFSLSVTGELLTLDAAVFFNQFAGSSSSVIWLVVAFVMTILIVSSGVTKGIEKLNKITMPILLLLFIILLIRSVTLPGAEVGIEYLLKPRWEYLFNLETCIMALGQAFFSVSLSGCSLVVYGSYTNDEYDIISSAFGTAIFDTIAALLAAFIIVPATFSFGFDPASGPALLFMTLPSIFKMMPYGNLMAILFFLSIIFAAISSSIGMLEGPVEALMTRTKFNRVKSTIIISVICLILALPLAINMNLFNSFADFVTIILSPAGTVITAFVFFYLYKGDLLAEINIGAKYPLGKSFIYFGRIIFVPITVLIIVLGIIYGGIG